VMEMDRIAPDLVLSGVHHVTVSVEQGVVEGPHLRAAHALHGHVANINAGSRHEDRVPARAFRVLGADHDIAREITDVRKELERTVGRSGPGMVELQGRLDSDLVARHRCDPESFITRDEALAPLAFPQLSSIGNHNLIADRPTRWCVFKQQCGLPCEWLGSQSQERGRLDRAVHPHRTKSLDRGCRQ
jgi:hypothetical protein